MEPKTPATNRTTRSRHPRRFYLGQQSPLRDSVPPSLACPERAGEEASPTPLRTYEDFKFKWNNSPFGCFFHASRKDNPFFDFPRCRRDWQRMDPRMRAPFFTYSETLQKDGELPEGAADYQLGPFANQKEMRSGESRDVSSPGTPAASHASGTARRRRGDAQEPRPRRVPVEL